jgi:hypothetical protein
MWTQISKTDESGLARYVQIMKTMDGRYAQLETSHLVRAIEQRAAEVWYYDGGDFELVMRFEYDHRRTRYRLVSVGMAGLVTPQAALDLCVDRIGSFVAVHLLEYLWTVRPKEMDNPDIQDLHDRALEHPSLDVTVERENDQKSIWRIEYVGVAVGG